MANIIADTKTIISNADIVLKVNTVHKDGKGADDIKNYNKIKEKTQSSSPVSEKNACSKKHRN